MTQPEVPQPDWHRIAPILQAALERPARERAEFVRQACAGDAALLTEIESLLAADREAAAGRFLEAPGRAPAGDPPIADGARARLVSGQRFGPYGIVRLIGRGGMGEVYEAEHLEQGRRIALKVLNERLSDPRARDRFLREGQLAASVTHPNVVYVFGSEEIDGVAAIAMELLPGGTLKDRVRRQGPLDPAAAVDAILQVVAGLEAAHAAGVLHRDVKPANCFVDRDGTVKIGDFGLSISTAPDTTQLTSTGTLRATPQFAAPEQLRGLALDLRADIYAVGATLYYLLTGRPPFDDRDLLTLLTRVVTDAPPSPRDIVPSVPKGLAAVVMRCLAKLPDARFKSYRALRAALLPLGSAAAKTATMTTRFAAGVVDRFIVLLGLMFASAAIRTWSRDVTAGTGSSAMLIALLVGAYFTLTEGISGASPGKWVFGLRVTDEAGGKPSVAQVVGRSALFAMAAAAPYVIPTGTWVRALVPDNLTPFDAVRSAAVGRAILFLYLTFPLAPLALFLTARRRHGFAGLHDLVSGTRVTRAAPEPALAPVNSPDANAPVRGTFADGPAAGTRGPYLLYERLETEEPIDMWRAFDPALKREVWVRDAAAGTPLADVSRRDLARPGRLRWLGGRQEADRTWEAFEAPAGRPLLALVPVPQPWRTVRQWLTDIARERAACREEPNVPAFTLNHVWITPGGRAMLLDFPSPGTTVRPSQPVPATVSPAREARDFVYAVAATALTGRAPHPTGAHARIVPPLPPAGTRLMQALHEATPMTPQDLLDACARAAQARGSVSRWARGLVPAAIATSVAAYLLSVFSVQSLLGGPALMDVGPGGRGLFSALAAVERLRRSGVSESDPERRALETFLVRAYAPLATRASSFGGALRPFRPLALDIAARRPSPSDDDLVAAANLLGRARLDDLNRGSDVGALRAILLLPPLALPFFAALGALSALLAFALRGGLALRLFGIIAVDADGREASRWRAMGRSALAWSPLFALYLMADWIFIGIAIGSVAAPALACVILLLLMAGVARAVAVPERGLQERMTGTWLVPR